MVSNIENVPATVWPLHKKTALIHDTPDFEILGQAEVGTFLGGDYMYSMKSSRRSAKSSAILIFPLE